MVSPKQSRNNCQVFRRDNQIAKVTMLVLVSIIAPSFRHKSMNVARAFVPMALKSNMIYRTPTRNFNNHYAKQNVIRGFMAAADTVTLTDEQKVELEAKITAKGDEIRALKESGADKAAVAPLVKELLSLKATLDPSSVKPKKEAKKKKQNKQAVPNDGNNDETSDFITPRAENYSKWYNDIIRVTGLAETSPVRGCMVIKPWGMSLWERVRDDLDVRIKEHGAENAYFPLLIPKSFLSKEAEHVDGFAKECAVVTHHRLTADPSGEKGLIADPEAELEDPLIIRPTSETMIWTMFKKWIISHR